MAKSKNETLDAIGDILSASLTAPLGQLTNALSKLKQVSDAVFGSLNKLTSAVQSSISSYTQLFNPAATKLLDRAIMDLNASIGQALMPALEISTSMIRALGNVIASLSPNSQKLLVALALSSIAAVAAAAATGVLTAMVTALALSEDAATFGLSGLVAAVVTFATTLAVGATALAAVNKPLEMFNKFFDEMANAVESLLDLVGDAFQKVADAGEPLLQFAVDFAKTGIGRIGELVIPLIRSFAGLMQQLTPLFETVLPALASFFFSIQNFTVLVIELTVLALRPLLVVLNLVLKPIAWIVEGIAFLVNILISATRYVAGIGSAMQDHLLSRIADIGTFLTNTFGPALSRLKNALFSVGSALMDLFRVIGGIVTGAGGRIMAALQPVTDFIERFVIFTFQLLAYTIEQVAIAIEWLIRNFRELLGVVDQQKTQRVDPNAASGMAVRQAQIGTVQSFISRAQTNAFSAGKGTSSPEEQTAKNTATMAQNFAEMTRDVKAIKDSVIGLITNPVQSTINAGRNLLGIKSAAEEAGAMAGMEIRKTMQYMG